MASCTASLVGERLALTNAHCVHDHEGAPAQPGGAQAQLRQARGPAPGGRRGGRLLGQRERGRHANPVSPPYQPSLDGRQSDLDCGRDWAILELGSHPVGLDHLEVLDGAEFRSSPVPGVYRGDELLGDGLVVAGYSGDLNEGRLITMDYGCPILGTGDAVEYKCATFSGSSGSPILLANGLADPRGGRQRLRLRRPHGAELAQLPDPRGRGRHRQRDAVEALHRGAGAVAPSDGDASYAPSGLGAGARGEASNPYVLSHARSRHGPGLRRIHHPQLALWLISSATWCREARMRTCWSKTTRSPRGLVRAAIEPRGSSWR